MAVIYVRLHNPRETVYFQSILGTYSHLAWIRTERAEEGIIKLISTDDLIDELREVLKNLRAEIEFEEVQI
jgi:predicted AlkP superfamily phosphohydrolase/phosphomutase